MSDCNAWRVMRLQPYTAGGTIRWRGVNADGTARYIHQTYRQIDNEPTAAENRLATRGGSNLPFGGLVRGRLYREDNKLRARALGWGEICEPCGDPCDNDPPVRTDIEVVYGFSVDIGGLPSCCQINGTYGVYQCDVETYNPDTDAYHVNDCEPCASIQEDYSCTQMGTYYGALASNIHTDICDEGISDDRLMAIKAFIYCCYKEVEDGLDCKHYVHVRLWYAHGFGIPRNCCHDGITGPDSDTCVMYEGCIEIPTAALCGDFNGAAADWPETFDVGLTCVTDEPVDPCGGPCGAVATLGLAEV